jgi:hypothetical protein
VKDPAKKGSGTATFAACLFGVMTLGTFAFLFWMFAFRSQPSGAGDLANRLVGQWAMVDGSEYVVEFTRDGTMSVRNHAGEPQVLLAGDEQLPCRFLSDSVVGVPNRGLNVPDKFAFDEAGYVFVFSVSIEGDRLTLRGQPEGETIILSQDGKHEVRFPGSESQPLKFIRRE